MTLTRILSLALLTLSISVGGSAQQAQPSAQQRLAEWRTQRAAELMDDFGELSRYRQVNSELKTPSPGEDRVVFFGDSITDIWDMSKYFPGKPYLNRGISGQTTPQMLVRFRQDVIALQPRVVVILAGTNDIAGNTGPMSLADIEANYASMAELARANGIRVVFSSVLPVHNYTGRAAEFFALRDPARILSLNRWLQDYCAANGHVYLDYFSSMVDKDGFLRRELADDGLHPNDAGYKIMAPLAEGAIAKAVAEKH